MTQKAVITRGTSLCSTHYTNKFTLTHTQNHCENDTEIRQATNILVGNGLSRPVENLRTHLRTQDMSGTCPFYVPGLFSKKNAASKSFEDICPVLSFLEDII